MQDTKYETQPEMQPIKMQSPAQENTNYAQESNMQNAYINPVSQPNNAYSTPAYANPAPYAPSGIRGMKWFKFLIYFMLFVNMFGMLVGVIGLVAFSNILDSELESGGAKIIASFADDIMASFDKAEEFMTGLISTLGTFGICCICLAVLALIARITLGGYKKSGPFFINLYFIVSSILPYIFAFSLFNSFVSIIPFDAAIYNGPSESLIVSSFTITMLIPFAINFALCFANYSYFKKRKDLFVR